MWDLFPTLEGRYHFTALEFPKARSFLFEFLVGIALTKNFFGCFKNFGGFWMHFLLNQPMHRLTNKQFMPGSLLL